MTVAEDIYWTGGWDSTFHVLQLAVDRGALVQPHYVIEEERRSAMAEINALKRLRGMIHSQFPTSAGNILPTKFIAKSDLDDNTTIRTSFTQLQQRFPTLGTQYEWMALYCAQENIYTMRVCAEKAPDSSGPVHVYNLLKANVEPIDDAGATAYRIPDTAADADLRQLFGNYLLPLLDTTKLDMAAIAADKDWTNVMAKTWFCHFPTRRMKPCGRCNPCLQVAADGLGRRLPWRARLLARFSKGY